MIFLGNKELIIGLRFCGAKGYFETEEIKSIIPEIKQDEVIVATNKIISDFPTLSRYPNLTIIPDNPTELQNTSDLNEMIKRAIGVEMP